MGMQEHIDGFTCYKSHLHSQDSHVTQLSLSATQVS